MAPDRRPVRDLRAQRQGPVRRSAQIRGRRRLSAPPGDDKRDRLAERLRALRLRLDAAAEHPDGVDPDAWELDLYSYDESLIVAADLLDLEVPKGGRGEMNSEQRTVLEGRLADAGLDVRSAR